MARLFIGGAVFFFIARNLVKTGKIKKSNFYWVDNSQMNLEQLQGTDHINYNLPQYVSKYFYKSQPYKYTQNKTYANRVSQNLAAFDSHNYPRHINGVHARMSNMGRIRKGPRGFATEVRPFTKFG